MNKTRLTKIYLVRHGESEANAGVKTNDINGEEMYGSPLTKKGKLQAREVSRKLKDIQFDAIFSSDLTRAVQTAEIIKLERDVAIKTSDQIRERSFHQYLKQHPNKTYEQLESELQKALESLDDKARMTYKHSPGMESVEASAIRLITFLREIAVAYPGKIVLVTNHGNLMRNVLTHLGWATFDELPHGSIDNAGYIILESDGVDFFIRETHGIRKEVNAKRIW